MLNSMMAARAYSASAAHRSLRDQEADIFRQANAILRKGRSQGATAKTKALADNGRLWMAVIDLLRDPDNALSHGLRAGLISVGLTPRAPCAMGSAPPSYPTAWQCSGKWSAHLRISISLYR